jgi:predicted alpha/beta superfamily hydrolase
VTVQALLAAATTLVFAAGAQAETPVVGRLTSAALGEVREFTVRVPTSYAREPRRRYPVIYVLDGPPLDDHTAQAATQSATLGRSPELIVVGIPNMRRGGRARDFLPPYLSFRRRDGSLFTGEADQFLHFLKDELIPRIERDYRTAGPRLLSGHSLGGVFVCYSLTAAPALFDGRFAHSPAIWRDEDEMASRLSRWLRTARSLDSYLYLSVGAREGDELQSGYHRLRAALTEQASGAGLTWQASVTPEAVHETNVALATPASLQAFFASAAGRRYRP